VEHGQREKSNRFGFDHNHETSYGHFMNHSPIDWEQLDMIADGFTPDFVEIYHEYVAEIPMLFNDMRQKVHGNDAAAAARVAHQIKGSSANFGFTGVSQPIAELEQQSKAGSLDNAPILLAEAETGFAQAVAEVKALRSV
jgi:HPt (histidine-containing phosphotransfer) domain-containing protein